MTEETIRHKSELLWRSLLLVAVGTVALTSACGGRVAPLSARIADIEKEVMRRAEEDHTPGLSIVIVKGQEVLLSRGFGLASLEHHVPATEHTVYRLASAAKFFTCLTLMSMVEEGVLDLDAPIGRYSQDVNPDWADIPVWRFLNHTSGLPMMDSSPEMASLSDQEKAGLTVHDFYDAIKGKPLEFAPGSQWRYQQSGFVVVFEMLLKDSGRSFVDLVSERVLNPAAMSSTLFGDSTSVVMNRNPASYHLEEGKYGNLFYYYPPATYFGAGLNSSVADLSKLFRALNRGEVVSPKILQSSYHEKYVHPLNDTTGYGISTVVEAVNGSTSIGHSGGNGFASIQYFPVEGLGIAVLSNRGNSGLALELTREIADRLTRERD